MKKLSITLTAFMTIAAMLVCAASWAQSPAATASGKLSGGANVTIKYSSPSVKGRKVWGDLVPYDKVWRAGANEATTVEFDKDVTIGGKSVPKGKYSVYITPSASKWTFHINSQTGQWGINRDQSTTRDAAKDVASVDVTPTDAPMTEALKYEVVPEGFKILWEKKQATVPVK